ncbi:MAG TPA: PA2169 family four-helix-bundle protein [Opitutus sp.]|nr:PA2169 family four-helix-bundle protein [Opitutus sp.]
MRLSNEKNIHVLNDLIETCRDGEHGYSTAAKEAKDPELARVFNQYATQRSNYLRELQQAVRALGGNPEKSGSVSGSLHRGWIDLKAAMSKNEPHAVLAECERGEDAAVKNYREALNEAELDTESRALVQRQFAGVKEAHDRIKQLRDSVAYARK